MSRPYSIVVFGATGFTGKRVVAYLASTCKSEQELRSIAMAGRNRGSLEKVSKENSNSRINNFILANVDDYASLVQMAKQAKVVLDCVGPYRYWGESVVRACVEGGADFLDVSGEPDYIERMEFKYNGPAQAAGVYVVSGVGFDSVPADLGTLYTQRLFKPPSVPVSVESFITIKFGDAGLVGNYATWESAVMGIGAQTELAELRKAVKRAGSFPGAPPVAGPKPRKVDTYAWEPRVGAYIIPFLGSDASIVRRTQAGLPARGEAAVHFAAYFTIPTAFYLAVLFFYGTLLQVLSQSSFGRSLLLTFPRLFSGGVFRKGGPSQAQIDGASFSMTFIGKGYSKGVPASPGAQPDRTIVTRIDGPESGYVTTPIIMVEAARVLLEERNKLPRPGVYTSGLAFGNTTLLDRIGKAGVTISLISDTTSSQP
eukprot:jgi/Botrbrau1/14848/Bobra.0326s0002.1